MFCFFASAWNPNYVKFKQKNLIYFQIFFFEEKNFQGHHYECSGDSAELQPYLTRCNSIRVESGCWMAYEKSNFSGYQYMLHKGEYPDYHHWAGFNDRIHSCRMVPSVSIFIIPTVSTPFFFRTCL